MNKINNKTPVSILILTYNEEIHLKRLLNNLAGFADQIIIIDSCSTDNTLESVGQFGCDVYQHQYEHHSQQLNWSLQNAKFNHEWILNLDADERLTDELKKEIEEKIKNVPADVCGFMMKRRVYFQGRWMKHGGYYPFWVTRLFRKGKGFSEDVRMDEKFIVEGKTEKLRYDLIDENLKGIDFWIRKHNTYAQREAHDVFSSKTMSFKNFADSFKEVKSIRRIFKFIYYKFPLFIRAFLYFLFRYFFLLGFLDGKAGLTFHFLQGCWYRFLVDVYILELNRKNSKGI